jgi:hypothetical protein
MTPCPENLVRYTKALSGVSSAGLETTDEKLIAIVTAIEKKSFDDARERIADLDRDDVYDVRIFAFACYLAWREGGFASVPWILEAVRQTLGSNLASIGPQRKKEAHLDVRLGWAFGTMSDDVVYHEKTASPEWAAWTKPLTPELVERIYEARRGLDPAVGAGPTPRANENLRRFFKEAEQVLVTTQRAATAAREKAAKEAAARAAEQEQAMTLAENTRGTTRREDVLTIDSQSRADIRAGSDRVEIVVSPAFLELLRKLQAFETLVAKQKFQRAALVADDVTGIVSNFDPRTYFPELFSQFGKDLAENIDVLATHWEARDSLSWKALEQYYRVDLARFVDG